MRSKSVVTVLTLVLCVLAPAAFAGEPRAKEAQIAGALAAAPMDAGEGATILGYGADGALVTLREGTGLLVCLADDPGDEKFHTACYHKELEPFMVRGRELKAEGVGAGDRHRLRHEEIDAGKLEFPKRPTSLYTVTGTGFDAETGKVEGASRVYVVYLPYATEETTGLPAGPDPDQPSAPWIMRVGTPSAHIMITPGPEEDDEEPEGKPR